MDRVNTSSLASALIASPLGPLAAAAGPRGVRILSFTDGGEAVPPAWDAPDPDSITPAAAHLARLVDELARFFDGSLRHFTVPLDLRGTPFQLRVWRRLLEIPYGTTISYRTLAEDVGSPHGYRAVGAANGRNPVAVIVPCHRVIAHNGALGGYGGGLDRKQFLLDLEQQVAGTVLPADAMLTPCQ